MFQEDLNGCGTDKPVFVKLLSLAVGQLMLGPLRRGHLDLIQPAEARYLGLIRLRQRWRRALRQPELVPTLCAQPIQIQRTERQVKPLRACPKPQTFRGTRTQDSQQSSARLTSWESRMTDVTIRA